MRNSTAGEPQRFTVYVDDNFHFMDEDSRWENGVFATYEEALAKCQDIVRTNLEDMMGQCNDAREAHGKYVMFGEDPWIDPTPAGLPRFSAREYAETLVSAMIAAGGA